MDLFCDYAAFYDLLYRDKDFAAEAGYAGGLIRRHRPEASALLDLGCGTGRHAAHFADLGFAVTGVDRSAAMLREARARMNGRASFVEGDIRSFSLDAAFDAATSLFHVCSYLTADADLASMLKTVRRHLRPGGVLLFDFWYGPAVLHDLPQTRVKRLSDGAGEIVRISEPVLKLADNVVEVHYELVIRAPAGGAAREIREVHPMRYWFEPELRLHLASAGFEGLGFYDWLTGAPPRIDSWNACCVARTGA